MSAPVKINLKGLPGIQTEQLLAQHQSWQLLSPARVSPELSLFIASERSGYSPLSSGGKGDSSGDICVGSAYKRSDNHYAD